MLYDLFPDNPLTVPANAGNTGADTSVGMKWQSSVDCYCVGLKFFLKTASQSSRDIAIYALGGSSPLVSLLGGSFSNNSTWSTWTWATPLRITAGTTYVAVIYSSLGDIEATYSAMTVDQHVGPITASASGTNSQFNGVWAFSVGSMSNPPNTDTTVQPLFSVSPVLSLARVMPNPSHKPAPFKPGNAR